MAFKQLEERHDGEGTANLVVDDSRSILSVLKAHTLAVERDMHAEPVEQDRRQQLRPDEAVRRAWKGAGGWLIADSDEVARVYRYEVARGFRDDVVHLSDLISPGDEAFWPAGSLASVKPRGQSGIATSTCFSSSAVAVGMWATPGVVQVKRHVHSVRGLGLSGGLPSSAQALAGEIEPMGIVDEAIEHGVGVGGISNEQMPLVHGELAGDDGGTVTVAIFEDFQEVMTGGGIERFEPPIVQSR
ncbi:hypothetical protein ACVWW6_000166 [Bradyrhizobium sp. USDA 3311]